MMDLCRNQCRSAEPEVVGAKKKKKEVKDLKHLIQLRLEFIRIYFSVLASYLSSSSFKTLSVSLRLPAMCVCGYAFK